MATRLDKMKEIHRRGLGDRLQGDDKAYYDTLVSRNLIGGEQTAAPPATQAPAAPVAAPTPEQAPVEQQPLSLIPHLVEGATLGWSDELLSKISGRSPESLEAQRQAEAAQLPKAVVVGSEIAGALAPSLTGAGAVAHATRGSSPLLRGISQLILGTTEGTVTGAGVSEEGERTGGAVLGGLFGAAAEVAVPALIGVGKKMLPKRPTAQLADEAISQAVGGVDPSRRAALLGPEATVAELAAPEGGALLRETLPRGGAAKEAGEQFLDAQEGAIVATARKDAERALGTSPVAAQTSQTAKVGEMAEKAKNLYNQAAPMEVKASKELAEALNTPEAFLAERGALEAASANRRPYVSPFGAAAPSREAAEAAFTGGPQIADAALEPKVVPGAAVHTGSVKGLLDSMESMIQKEASSDTAAGLIKQKRAILDALEKSNPTFKKAQKEFASMKRLEEAYDAGSKALGSSKQDMKGLLAGATEAEMEAARRGAVQAVELAVKDAPSGVPSALKREGTKANLSLLFGEAPSKAVAGIVPKAQARKALTGEVQAGLKAGARGRAAEAVGTAGGPFIPKGYSPKGMTFGVGSEIVSRVLAKETPQAVIDEVTKKLLSADNAEQALKAIIKSGVEKKAAEELVKQITRAASTLAAPAGLLATE